MKRFLIHTRREFLKTRMTGAAVLAAMPLGAASAAHSDFAVSSRGPHDDSRQRLLEIVRNYGGEFGEAGKEE